MFFRIHDGLDILAVERISNEAFFIFSKQLILLNNDNKDYLVSLPLKVALIIHSPPLSLVDGDENIIVDFVSESNLLEKIIFSKHSFKLSNNFDDKIFYLFSFKDASCLLAYISNFLLFY